MTPGVQLVNFSHTEDGSVLRVTLGKNWSRMFETLPLSGSGLIMTRNESAIVGVQRVTPTFHFTPDGSKATGEGGDLLLNFRHFGTAHAIHIRRPTGHVFGVEFEDGRGRVMHRFTLSPQSDMDEFFAWVRLHQACAAEAAPQWNCTRENVSTESGAAFACFDGSVLECIAPACVNRAIPLRITVRSAAASQRIVFTPKSIRAFDDWWFLSDDVHGFHFSPENFASVALHECSGGKLRLRATSEEDDSDVLLMEAADLEADEAWRHLLKNLA